MLARPLWLTSTEEIEECSYTISKIGLIEFWLDMSWLVPIKRNTELFNVSLATTTTARNEHNNISHSPHHGKPGLCRQVNHIRDYKVWEVQKGGRGLSNPVESLFFVQEDQNSYLGGTVL